MYFDQKSCHFLARILRVPENKWSNFWEGKKLVMSLCISLDKFKILISCFFSSNYTNFLMKYGFLHYFVIKNLVDKISKIKNLRWKFRTIFCWLCRGVFNFLQNKMDTFSTFCKHQKEYLILRGPLSYKVTLSCGLTPTYN